MIDDFISISPEQWRRCGQHSKVFDHSRKFELFTENRAEMAMFARHENKNYSYHFDVYLPPGFSQNPQWQSFCQWHDSWDVPSEVVQSALPYRYTYGLFMKAPPPAILLIENQKLVLQVTEIEPPFILDQPVDYTSPNRVVYASPQLKKYSTEICDVTLLENRRSHFEINAVWSSTQSGEITVIVNDRFKAKHIGRNIFNQRGNFWKLGYYRHPELTESQAVEISNVSCHPIISVTIKQSSVQKQLSHKRNVTNWSAGITTAPRQQPTLERTLNSLVEAGWVKPHLFAEPATIIPDSFQHLPISKRHQALGAFPNWYMALTEMVLQQPQAEAFFICQDDVLFSAGLRDYLEQHLWSTPDTGVVSVYCPSHYAIGKPEGFHIENRGWNSWGALAYIFPNRSARHLLSDPMVLNHRDYGPASGLRNIDSVVGAWCQRANLQYIVHSPSLAQHIGDTSTIWTNGSNQGQRRANTFSETLT